MSTMRVALFGLLPLLGLACDQPRANPVPRIHVRPPALDLGTIDVPRDEPVEISFTIANRGTGALRLLRATASCGCTVLSWPKSTISPGEVVRVPVQVTPRPEPGQQRSLITLACNDPASSEIEVSVRWTARLPMRAEPAAIDFGSIGPDQSVMATLDVMLGQGFERERLELRCQDRYLTVRELDSSEAESRTVPEDASARRTIRIRLETDRHTGPRAATLAIRSHDGRFESRVPINWRVGPPVEVTPAAVFHSIPAGKRVPTRLLLRGLNKPVPSVSRIELDGHGVPFNAEGTDDPSGMMTSVRVDLQAGTVLGTETHELRIIFGTAGDDALTVPVTFIVE